MTNHNIAGVENAKPGKWRTYVEGLENATSAFSADQVDLL